MSDGGAGEVRRHRWSRGGLGLVTRLRAAKMQGQGVTAGSGCYGEVPARLFDCLLGFPCPLFSPGEQNLPGAAGAQCGCLEMPTAKGM